MAWLTGWGRRKSKNIAGSTAGAQANYQMLKIRVHKTTGTDTSSGANGTIQHVYVGANVRDDFGDVVFTKADGTTHLDFWMETFVSGDYADFYVEVDSIPESPDTVDIYVYYDKIDETTTSDSQATLSLFDVFDGDSGAVPDDTKWTISKGPHAIVELDGTGRLKMSSDDAGGANEAHSKVYSINTFDNVLIEYKWEMGVQLEWYPSFYGFINAAGFGTVTLPPDNGYSSVLSTGAQYPNEFRNFNVIERKDASNINSWAYDITDITAIWIRLGVYGTKVKCWVSYDGSSWTLVVEQTATNNLAAGSVGFYNPCHGDRVNDERVVYIIVRNYASPEPSWGAFGSEETEVAVAYMRPMKYW